MKIKSLLLILVASLVLSGCSFLDRQTKAGLQVITGETPSSVFLDGQYLDKTPLITKELKPGEYTIKIQPDDPQLTPYETTLTLTKGLLTVVTWKLGTSPETSGGVIYEMEKLPNSKAAELSVVSIPDGAIITMADQAKQFAPLTLPDLPAGQQELEISLPSYETQKHAVNMVAGYKTTMTIKLARSEVIEVDTTKGTPRTTQQSPTPSASPTTALTPSSTRQASAAAQTTGRSATGSGTTTGARVSIKSTGYFQDGKEVLRVRASSNPSSAEVGVVDVGQEYAYLGQTQNNWHQIRFGTQTGWVSGQYATIIRQ